jgi:dUTP pyrophosphatase
MTQINVLIQAEPELMPTMGNPGDAGYDLRSNVDAVVPSRGRTMIATGVKVAIPSGYVGLVHPRSGLAAKHGITILNAPGTIDSGYRGEIAVTLINHSDQDFKVNRLDRIAQIVFQEYSEANFITVQELPGTQRGQAGFGSTGVA